MPREKIYDGKTIFEAWCSWGAAATETRLREYARVKFGGTSQMGAKYAMWRWAFNNPEEAFPLWKDWFFNKYPDREQPTFEDFTPVVLREVRANRNVGKKRIDDFCAKYGLKYEIKIKKGDVVQIVRRNHPLFQALLIVDKIEDEEIEAFLVNDDAVRSVHTLSIHDIGVIDKALYDRKQGVVTRGKISRIPSLEVVAREMNMPLRKIEVSTRDAMKVYVFIYAKKSNEENPSPYYYSPVYYDIDNGIDEEILRLKKLRESFPVGIPEESPV